MKPRAVSGVKIIGKEVFSSPLLEMREHRPKLTRHQHIQQSLACSVDMRNPKRTTHSIPHAYERVRLPNPQLGIKVAPNNQQRISLSRLDSSLQFPQKEFALPLRST